MMRAHGRRAYTPRRRTSDGPEKPQPLRWVSVRSWGRLRTDTPNHSDCVHAAAKCGPMMAEPFAYRSRVWNGGAPSCCWKRTHSPLSRRPDSPVHVWISARNQTSVRPPGSAPVASKILAASASPLAPGASKPLRENGACGLRIVPDRDELDGARGSARDTVGLEIDNRRVMGPRPHEDRAINRTSRRQTDMAGRANCPRRPIPSQLTAHNLDLGWRLRTGFGRYGGKQ